VFSTDTIGAAREDFRTTRAGPDQTNGSNRNMSKAKVQTIRGNKAGGWKRRFADPIVLPDGRRLVTLQDAGDYITNLPKAEHGARGRQTAIDMILKPQRATRAGCGLPASPSCRRSAA
jgi:hypothetical protein